MQGLILKDNTWHLIKELPEEPKQPPHYIDFTDPAGFERHFEIGGDVFSMKTQYQIQKNNEAAL